MSLSDARTRSATQPRNLAGLALSPRAAHESYKREVSTLLDAVLAGDLIEDGAAVERQVVRSLGALARLQQRHTVDERGRCSICRATSRAWWRPWPRRSICTVYSALGFYLVQPERFVLSVIADTAVTVGERS